jgi:hypothetical protein
VSAATIVMAPTPPHDSLGGCDNRFKFTQESAPKTRPGEIATPQALHTTAQGRAAHPGKEARAIVHSPFPPSPQRGSTRRVDCGTPSGCEKTDAEETEPPGCNPGLN